MKVTKKRIKRNKFFYFIQFCLLVVVILFTLWHATGVFNLYHPLWVIIPTGVFYLLFALAYGTLFDIRGKRLKFLRNIVGYWMAGGFIFFFIFLVLILLNLAIGISPEYLISTGIAISTIIIIYSYRHASKVFVKNISFYSDKISKKYTFVQLSDIHLGSNGKEEIEGILLAIKNLKYDFLVITGDLVDEDYATKYDLEPLGQITTPIFYITGNHEYYLRHSSFKDFLRGINIIDNNDTKHIFEEIDIYGIDEKSDTGEVLDTLSLDNKRYSLCLMHEPKTKELEKAQERGIDLMLSGHTHNGQIFPFNLIVKVKFPYIKGDYTLGDMDIHVSQGTGTWGPKMRLGTSNEITLITIEPKGFMH
jgi:predicted MPP superfamily phosphohydrolase